jgi:hypothetical protein
MYCCAGQGMRCNSDRAYGRGPRSGSAASIKAVLLFECLILLLGYCSTRLSTFGYASHVDFSDEQDQLADVVCTISVVINHHLLQLNSNHTAVEECVQQCMDKHVEFGTIQHSLLLLTAHA